jgi:hypothetical protein
MVLPKRVFAGMIRRIWNCGANTLNGLVSRLKLSHGRFVEGLPSSTVQVVLSDVQHSLACNDTQISSMCKSETPRALSVRKSALRVTEISGTTLNNGETLKLPFEPPPFAVT